MVIIKNMNLVLKDIQLEKDNVFYNYFSSFPIPEKLIETIVSFIKK